jgi:phospholipid N-methyltransferase
MITRDINGATGKVLELGPGTGVFTKALLKQGVKEGDLTLIEYGSDFMRLLQQRFPHARVLWMDASWIAPQNVFERATFGAVVSGLPLLNMAKNKVDAILAGVFNSLRPDGVMYQFTYGVRCPVSLSQLEQFGLQATCVGRVLINVPPASVYRITRRQTAVQVAE